MIKPPYPIRRRSFSVAPSAGRITSPSSTSRPTRVSSTFLGSPGARRITSPFFCTTARGTPFASASRACSARCRASPCTGTTICGRTHLYIWISSGRPGWPETWTCACRSVTIFTPRSDSWFMIRPIATSLPGMIRDEKITVSSSVKLELVRARGNAAKRSARLALPARRDDQQLARAAGASLPRS